MNIGNEMKVEKATEDKEQITVVTSGAKYVFEKNPKKGKIFCYQRINGERLLAEIEFDYPFAEMSLEHYDEKKCLVFEKIRFQVNSDSVLEIGCRTAPVNVSVKIRMDAAYEAWHEGNLLMLDEVGGTAIFHKNVKSTNFYSPVRNEFVVEYQLNVCDAHLLVSILPPRRFQEERLIPENISHYGVNLPYPVEPFPTDAMLEDAAKYSNIFILHTQMWQGRNRRRGMSMNTIEDLLNDQQWSVFDYEPVKEGELVRIVKKCHSLKMKVLPYISMYYSLAREDDFLDKAMEVMEKYDFDGIYSDGYVWDVFYSYYQVKKLRKLLGDKLLYLHNTMDPFYNRYLFCPFINTYADFVLRGEFPGEFDENYMRYGLSGYNSSNTINYVCHVHYTPEFVESLIEKAARYKMKFYLNYPEYEADRILKKKYFPNMKELYC